MINPDSLRQKVFTKKKENTNLTLQDFYKFFSKSNRNSIRTYFNESNKLYPPDISKGNMDISGIIDLPNNPALIFDKTQPPDLNM
ncbi:unnamed protein product, partial [marine sediment metagenome]